MCKVVTSGTLVTKDLAPSRGKRESNLGIENTCRSKTHDGTIHTVTDGGDTVALCNNDV